MSNRLRFIVYMSAAILLPHSCSINEDTPFDRNTGMTGGQGDRGIMISAYEPYMMRVKLSSDMASKFEEAADSSGRIFSAGVRSACTPLASAGVVKMERTFPYAGKFEPRTRAAGLHLWYDVYIDSSSVITKASEDISFIEGVDIVEFRPKTVLMDGGPFIFDDPEMPVNQWHYYNDGSMINSRPGADVNIVPVWEDITVGSEDVVVAVIDGGIDYDHEDLAANMWHNPDETGDQVYGYNFVNHNLTIIPENHGTHVAGTVAAVNNNGIGVGGIAGGDYARGISGVKLMSCQIFQGNASGSGSQAMKWAADHGAVIAQNSWGYEDPGVTSIPESDREAIDYFIENAGMDENGNQVGPMAGGVVIFAAGNSSLGYNYPSGYEKCIAVAAISSDYKAAYYTNYGDWVDVSAPGGDDQKNVFVYSTLPDNKYGGMAGTSQACPHVSGIAALAVSYLGGPGFTADALKERILNGVNDISSYNPGMEIGRGLIDAYKVLVADTGEPPLAVDDLDAVVESNNVTVTLTIPDDPDDDRANMVLIYYGEDEMDNVYTFKAADLYSGSEFTGSFYLPDFGKTYRLTAVVTDFSGNKSPASNEVSVTTGANSAPVVEPLSETDITMSRYENREIKFHIEDPQGHAMNALVEGDGSLQGIEAELVAKDTAVLRIDGPEAEPGLYDLSFVVEDDYGMRTVVPVSLEVLENRAPEMIKELKGVAFGSPMDAPVTIEWQEYFADPDGEPLELTAEIEDWSVGAVSVNSDGNMVAVPMGYGVTDAVVTVSDSFGEELQCRFKVVVRDGSQPLDLYPVPVVDTLHVRAPVDVTGDVSVMSQSGAVVYSGEGVDISVFSPLKIDMNGLPAGMYTVEVAFDGKVIKKEIARL